MGRYANYPMTVEDCLFISITKLKEWDYLSQNGINSGTISWSRNGSPHAKINIKVIKNDYGTTMILDYSANGTPINYKVEIISKQSNLGKGEYYYFICPTTGKPCRKLLLQNGYFLHREAFKNIFYAKQLESKKNRGLFKIFEACYLSDEVYDERYKKYFKTYYKGKETKRFKRLNDKIQNASRFPADTFERLLMM